MNTKCNKEEFIVKSKKLYGEESFDYSLVRYENAYTEIELICNKHGKFIITPNKHLEIVGGCPMCSKEKRKKKKMMSNDEYKQLVIKKHGNTYDLSKTVYKGMRENITAICSEHGEFSVNAYNFVHTCGCPICGINKRNKTSSKKTQKKIEKLTKERFIAESVRIFGDYYDYSKVDLKHKDTKNRVCIICPKHGEFWQNPYSHIHGHGCKKCGKEKASNEQKLTTKEFIKKAKIIHGDKYDYTKTKYNGCYCNVEIICPKHGIFKQKAYSHLNGHGCKKCANEENSKLLLSNTEDFIQKSNIIHKNKEDYSLVVYKNAKTPVTIICDKGHIYSQMPNKHLSGHGCPYCSNNISKSEDEIKSFLQTLGFTIQSNNRQILPHSKEIDIFIPSKNIAIEYDGLYWHNENSKNKNYHLDKTKECEKQNIQLIHIFEDEWLNHKDIVKSRLKSILGITENKIFARKCQIKEIPNNDCKNFINENHIQGSINASIKYGLYYHDKLVSIMTFGKLRKNLGHNNKNDEFELLRFCNKLDTTVIGGASKLLNHFIKTYNPKEIISYCDRRWSIGKLYEKLGFSFDHCSQPNYFYVIGQQRYNRFSFRKDILVKQGFDPNKSEHEIMLERGIYRIYDCGTKVYKWTNNTK